MNDDIRRLFERSEREMRPEFQANLIKLLDEPDRTTPAESSTDAAAVRLIEVELAPPQSPSRRRWHPGAWLGVAAALALVVAWFATPRGSHESVAPVVTVPVKVVPSDAGCALVAETLGVVATQTRDIRVGLMPDGSSFCLADDATGIPLVESGPIGANPADLAPPPEPIIVGYGAADTTAFYFLVAIPEGLPVASISASGDQVRSFPTRVGRQMLVIDTDYDSRVAQQRVTRDLNLYSSTGVVLATLAVDVDARSGVAAEAEP